VVLMPSDAVDAILSNMTRRDKVDLRNDVLDALEAVEENMPTPTVAPCQNCGQDDDLLPYGPEGMFVCAECALLFPEISARCVAIQMGTPPILLDHVANQLADQMRRKVETGRWDDER
jgi:hypothetical protein